MKKIFYSFFMLCSAYSSFAQFTVQPVVTATQLANTLAGSNVTIANPTITGASGSYATFTYSGSNFPMSSGIILSSGLASQAPGPNTQTGNGTDFGYPGNTLLSNISGNQTFDACEFQFDLQVQSSYIEFKYIFASEEYPEFVGSGFNDVFGFFISGPGITGWQNIALIPGTTTPVSINNVNDQSFWQYYVDNSSGNVLEFDGYTTELTAQIGGLQKCGTYTLKLVVADASDGIFDTGVFLEANSLVQGNVSATANTFSANNTALEGCIDASFTFNLANALAYNMTIPIGIGGTAINGVDYTLVDTMLIIPAGQTSASIIINALSDGIPEGIENIELYFEPAPCAPMDTVTLFINDYQTLQYENVVTDVSCYNGNNGIVDFTITGGSSPFTYFLTDSATGVMTSYTTDPITGMAPGTYYINVSDGYGCEAEDIVVGNQYTGGPVFLPDGNGFSYSTSLPIAGFSAGATLQSVSQLQSICINMEHSRIGELEIVLQAPNGQQIVLKQQPGGAVCNMGEPCATGPADAGNTDTSPGIGYSYCFTPSPTYGTMVSEANAHQYTYVTTCYGTTESDKYLPAGSYASYDALSNLIGVPLNGNWTLIITDNIPNNNGWVFDWSISFAADPPDSIITINQPNPPTASYTTVQPNCGLSNGSIDLTVSGTGAPFTYSWNTGATSEDLTNVPAGSYTVNVINNSACSLPFNVSLSSNGGVLLNAVIQDQLCSTSNSGAINLSVSGGANPITYAWSNGATTQDLTNLAPGVYAVTVSDGASCVSSASYTIAAASPIYVTGTVTNEQCADAEGTISLNVTGGNPAYIFNWSNGMTTQNITDLATGTYSVTVTDNSGCIVTSSYNVINIVGNCIPTCDLTLTNISFTNENCGHSNGSASFNVSTTNAPYTISWSNGASSSSIANLSAGSYTATVTDNEGCVATQTFTIQNQTSGLAISNSSITSETCGNNQGAINITTSGGALPTTFLWSNNATTEDLSGIVAGTYSVQVTDANNCSVTQIFSVTNQAGTLTQTYGNAMNSNCSSNTGSVDITIAGGQTPYTYLWSNGSTGQDLLNVGPGIYSCTITDGSTCQITTPSYTIATNSNGLTVNADIDNEICSQINGQILTQITGGTAPYTYLWNTGATTTSLDNISAGTYSVTVTSANGCSVGSGPLNVVNDPGSLALLSVNVIDETCSNNFGSINISVSGGNGPISYNWNTGAISQDLFGIAAGNYSCTISDSVGCITTASGTVLNQSGSLQLDNMIVTNEQCGNASGAINALYSGETNPVTFAWNTGSISQNITGLSAGSYNLTITDASGCSVSGTANVGNNTNGMTITLNSISNEVCGNASGAIDVSVSGGTSPIIYAWSNAANSQDLNALSAGNYSLTITDGVGCSASAGPFTVTNAAGTLAINQNSITNASCSLSNGAIDLSVSGGSSPYSYNWSNSSSTLDQTSLSAGTYTLTTTDANGCSIVNAYTITNTSGTLASATQITNENCGAGNGAINISPSGGSTPYVYSWSTGATTEDINGLSAGIYTLTLNDNAGCLAIYNYTVLNNPGTLTLSNLNSLDATCGNSSGAITVSYTGGQAPLTYLWSNGATTEDLSNLSAGMYNCTTTDANGCAVQIAASVNNDPGAMSIVTDSIMNETCGSANGAIYITVTGAVNPITYTWNNSQTTEDISSVSAGNYVVTVEDGNGCSSNHQVAVTNSGGQPNISSVNVIDEVCGNNNGSITVGVSGGTGPYTYSWGNSNCCSYTLHMHDSMGNGWFNGTYVSVYINSSLLGTYAVTGPQFDAIQNIPICNGDVISLSYTVTGTTNWQNKFWLTNTSGAIVYNSGYNHAAGSVYTGAASCSGSGSTASNLSAGVYTVTVSDANGCSSSQAITVGNSANTIAISNAVITNTYCGNSAGAINISVSGVTGPTYLWSTGATTQDISGVPAGIYTVTVSNASGCSLSQNYTVNNTTNGLNAGNEIMTDEYCGASNGSIDITPTGGVGPYTYSWSTGATTEDISSLSSGSYTITITDAGSCVYNQTYTLTNVSNGIAASFSVTNTGCSSSVGAIDLSVSGGFLPYTFVWSGGETSEDVTGLAAGTYTYTVTDNAGCMINGTAAVQTQGNPPVILGANVTNDFCGNGGGVNLTVSGGTSPYTYAWSNGATTEDITTVPAGVYTYTVTGSDGCIVSGSSTISSTASFTVTNVVINNATCGTCANGIINISMGPGGPYTYSWSTGATSQDVTGLLPGTYTVSITSNGCTIIKTYTVGTTVGITEPNANLNAVIYPNPSTGIFNLNVTLDKAADLSISLINMLGANIDERSISDFSEGEIKFDLSERANGIYFLQLKANGNTKVIKLVLDK